MRYIKYFILPHFKENEIQPVSQKNAIPVFKKKEEFASLKSIKEQFWDIASLILSYLGKEIYLQKNFPGFCMGI